MLRPPLSRAYTPGVIAGAMVVVLSLGCGAAEGRTGAADVPRARSEAAAPAALTITLLDLPARIGGQAVLVSDSSGTAARHVLIDGGDDSMALLRRLREYGVPAIDLMVLSHPHADHYVGFTAVLHTLPVSTFAWGGDVRTLASFHRMLDAVERSGAQVLLVDGKPRTVTVGDGALRTTITLIPPPPAAAIAGNNLNNRSVGVRVSRGRFALLIPGDAEHPLLRWWTRHLPELLPATVLVASHNGSDDANATARRPQWYRTVTPEALLVSANGRQHPYANVLEFARDRGVTTYCTHTHGTITVRVTGDGEWQVVPERPTPCRPGTEAPR